jgi:hypothetical protein
MRFPQLVIVAVWASLLCPSFVLAEPQPTDTQNQNANGSSDDRLENYATQAKDKIKEDCVKPTLAVPQTVVAENITVNAKICVFYSGDGFRPIDPQNPTKEELNRLLSGEVYFVALLTDGSDMKNVRIQSDIIGSLSRSERTVFNYDLYQGAPSKGLQIDLVVFDDDGWPSDNADKLKAFQDNVGGALSLYPPAAVAIPFIDPVIKLIVSTVNLIDPDDALISTKIFIEKGIDDTTKKTKWTIYNPHIVSDNGAIIFTIDPRNNSGTDSN